MPPPQVALAQSTADWLEVTSPLQPAPCGGPPQHEDLFDNLCAELGW